MHRRILLLVTDLQIGGTPTVVRELAIRLRRDTDAHVAVACLAGWGPVVDQLVSAGVPVTTLNARGPRDLWVLPRLVQLIRQQRFDTVFSFLVHANAAAAFASSFCPAVRFIQSIQTSQPMPRWHWWLQRAAEMNATHIVVPSPSVAEAAMKWADVPREKIVVIPNAVEPQMHADVHRSARNVVGFLGRLDPIKRVPDLLSAVALVPAVHLHIFGDGEQRAHIEDEIRRLGLGSRVTMHGQVAGAAEALKQIDVLVLPSEAEGFGLVLIEAMAAGVPVVATNVPGIRDVVMPGQTGLLVPPGDPAGLARAIDRVLKDDALRYQLVRNGIDDVRRRFAWPAVLPQYRALLGL